MREFTHHIQIVPHAEIYMLDMSRWVVHKCFTTDEYLR